MKRFILKILLLGILFGCKTTEYKETKRNPKPHWVESIPSHPDYYVGVFSTSKTGEDYRERAKKGALENLASEISVNVMGHSVLKTMETNDSFSQDYQNEVTIKSSENLEGYEVAGHWENAQEYWVYYRLSKAKYATIKKERIRKAIDLGKDYFTRAIDNHNRNNYHDAFILSIKALESVTDFLDQPLKTKIAGEEVYFGTEVLTYVQQMINEVDIKANQERHLVVLGDHIDDRNIYFTVHNHKGEAVSGIPLKCEYKAILYKTFEVISNKEGKVGMSLGKINQSKPEQTITAELNFNELAEDKSKDKIVLQLLNYLPHKTEIIKLSVRAPKVYIDNKEKEFGQSTTGKLSSIARQALISKGFFIVNNKEDADLIMLIDTDSQFMGRNQKAYLAELNGTVQVTHIKTGNIVFSEVIKPTKGLQLSKINASRDAYSKAELYIKRRVIPKLANQYFSF